MSKPLELIRNMGLNWFMYRSVYEFKKKLGLLERRYPVTFFSDEKLLSTITPSMTSKKEFVSWWKENSTPFFSSLETSNHKTLINLLDKDKVIKEADEICNYTFTYFSKWKVQYKALDWHYSPITKKNSPKDKHWMKIPDLAGEFGDIKYIWELSRFSFVYTLVRAFSITEDEKYVQIFWNIIEDWIENNPNQLGVNYKCCQEMSIRVMAWIFGLHAFKNHPLSTSDRIFSLFKTIYLHANHIEKHFEFSLRAVKNNHTITEAVGMYTVGLLFPFFDKSKLWKKKGLKHLQQEAMKQIYTDGSYLQHSMNYHRLMLQDYTWAIQLGKINGEQFSIEFLERVKKAVLFLYYHQDENTGKLPNYGMNDGALIHPLSTCDYLDYRPQLNAAYHIVTGKRLYESGIYDENLYWVCGREALTSEIEKIEKQSKLFEQGGYYILKGKQSSGTVRCATYKHRPFQADMLSLDLWWEGENVLTDAGTFSYNTDDKWLNYFNGTRSHNTIMLNQKDQMEKGSRFIWYKWLKSKVRKFDVNDYFSIFEGEHYGYKPYVHKRTVCNIQDSWVIIDDILGDSFIEPITLNQSWLFGIQNVQLNSNTIELNLKDMKLELLMLDENDSKNLFYYGDEENSRGWRSLYYGEKEPVQQMVRKLRINNNTRLITVIKPKEYKVTRVSTSSISIAGHVIHLNDIGINSIISNIEKE
ncbi:alginate lyase family protein [Bacillus cereus]|uniref:alginate lyase family protein n=1 Tax=Bacillus cereus TaxID=1396 RepID=UPI00356E4008